MNNSSLLINEYPLIVLPSLAKAIGINEALFVQQIHYWLVKSKNIHDGQRWVFNSYPKWQEQLPWLSVVGIKGIVRRLEKEKIIITGIFNKLAMDKTKWYRVNYEHPIFTLGSFQPTMGYPVSQEKILTNLAIPETTTETTTTLKKYQKETDSVFKQSVLELLVVWNETYGTKYLSLNAYRDNIKHWLATYSLEQIKQAIRQSKRLEWWGGVFKPSLFFRTRDKTGPVDHIGDAIAQPDEEWSRKHQIYLEVCRDNPVNEGRATLLAKYVGEDYDRYK
jgi:hypothetical protein